MPGRPRVASGLAPLLGLLAILVFSLPAAAEQSFETKYATIRFGEEAHLSDFLWRITGNRASGGQVVRDYARNRVDELVERVEALLDMYPDTFHFSIEIAAKASQGPPAEYSHERRCVYASTATVTDGILAHEIAHAVINAQFRVPPPEKAQEILARYVDQNLWSEPD